MNPIAVAQYGMMAASRRFEASAGRVAQQGFEADFARETVEQVSSKAEFSAGLNVIRTADEMMGDLLDIVS